MNLQEFLSKLNTTYAKVDVNDLKGELYSSLEVPPTGEVVELNLSEIYQTEKGSTYCMAKWQNADHVFKLNWLWNYLPKVCNEGQRVGAFGVVAEDLRAKGTVCDAVTHLQTHSRIKRSGEKLGFSYGMKEDPTTKKMIADKVNLDAKVSAEVYGWEWA